MIAIIAAMSPEMEVLRSWLTEPQESTEFGFTFVSGRLENRDVVLLQSGIGKVNAAMGTTLLINHFHPSIVLNTGSAGGLLSTQKFGEVVVSTAVVHHDVNVEVFGYAPGQVPGLPVQFRSDERLVALADQLLKGTPHTLGVIGSGDVFVHEPVRIADIRRRFPELCAVEMEASAIAQVCFRADVPFLVVRALSDIAGVESPMKFDEFLPLAAKNSSEMVRAMIRDWRP